MSRTNMVQMRRWDAHYGAIDVVATLNWAVVTGGADGAVKVWTLPSLYSTSPVALISFSAHTLPVTALVATPTRLFSASTDRSVKVYDLPSRSVSVSHSFPAALTCLVCYEFFFFFILRS
jgi:WD40 repeat protein